jgi:hypothetical protein
MGLLVGRPSRTLAGMTAWLVAEDGFRLVRIDSVVSVTLAFDNDRDDPTRYHPTKLLDRARTARLMVGAQGSDVLMCALTCPGRDAPEALKQLMAVLSTMGRKQADSSDVYVHAMYVNWPSRVPDRLWKVTSEIPDPEWIRR